MTDTPDALQLEEQLRLMGNFERTWSDIEVCPTCKGLGIQVHDRTPPPRARACVVCLNTGRVTRVMNTKIVPFRPAST